MMSTIDNQKSLLILDELIDQKLDELSQLLVKYNLTPTQIKVYLYLSRMGIKTASEISKSLGIARTETYNLLDRLRKKGIIFIVFGKPTKYNAVEIKKSIDILLNDEKNRLCQLEKDQESIIQLWNAIETA